MKSLGKISLLFMLITLSLVSCRKDQDNDGPTTTIPIEPPNIEVNASVFGLVKDDQGAPVEGANVEIDGTIVGQTNEDGAFTTGSMELNQYGSNVVVSKSGYFIGSKFVQPENGKQVYTELQLVTRSLSGNFSSTQGGEISANGSAKIQFGSNTIRDAAGNAYSGNVRVYAHWYDPSSSDLIVTMPGDLRAVNSENEFQQLGTYGMMAVELEDDNGNALNVLDGEEASLTFPVPSNMSSNAPSTIPMWYFDEGSGYWLEDGTASLVNGSYEASVSHFTFWNCDIPENFIELSGTVSDVNNNPLYLTSLKFTAEDASYGYAWVQADGSFSLKVPKDNELTMEAVDHCGDVYYSGMIGPFSVDTTLPNVTISTPATGWVTLTGQLLNCSGDPLTNGYLKIIRENGSYQLAAPDANGQISMIYVNCDAAAEVTLVAFDYTDAERSAEVVHPIPNNGTSDFGSISTCIAIDEYVIFEYNSETYTILDVYGGFDGGPIFEGSDVDSTSFSAYLGDDVLNTPINPQWMQLTGFESNGDWFNLVCQGCSDMEFTLTATASSPSEYFEGSFDGSILGANGVSEQVSGDFRIQRDN